MKRRILQTGYSIEITSEKCATRTKELARGKQFTLRIEREIEREILAAASAVLQKHKNVGTLHESFEARIR